MMQFTIPPNWQHLDLGVTSIGLMTKSPIGMTNIQNGLSAINTNFPDLSDYSHDKNNNLYALKKEAPNPEDEIIFMIKDDALFNFAWGGNIHFDAIKTSKNVFSIFAEIFQIPHFNIEWIDFKLYLVSKLSGNHYKIIRNALFAETPIGNLLAADEIIDNNCQFTGRLDENRIAQITINSDVTEKEIIEDKFSDDLLRLVVGIAQTKNFDGSLEDLIEKHFHVTYKYIQEVFIPVLGNSIEKELDNYSTLQHANV